MGCAQVKSPRVKLTPEQIQELEACREAVLQCMKQQNEGQVQNQSPHDTMNNIFSSEKRYSDSSIPTKNSLSSPYKKQRIQ